VARIVGKFKRLFRRGEEGTEERLPEEEAREVREEALQRALQIASKQLEPDELVETAKRDMSKALSELREYFGFERMVVIDRDGKPIGMSGGGSFETELIEALRSVFEAAETADTIIVSSESEGPNYLAVKINDSIAICETKTTPSDADIFMLRNDLSMVIESASLPASTEETDTPYVVTDRQGLVVASSGVSNPDRIAAEVSRLADFLDEHLVGELEWVKLTTDSGETLAVKPYKDVLVAFVVESDLEEVDEECEKVAKSLASSLEGLIDLTAETSASKSKAKPSEEG